VIGFTNDKAEQIANARRYFAGTMHRSLKHKVNYVTDITNENASKRLDKYKKLIIKEKNESKIRVYKNLVRVLEEEIEKIGGPEGITKTIGENITKKVNSEIAKSNKVQININAQKRAISFVNSLEVMPPRIPGQGKQSGAVMKIKAFINSNKNAFYAPREFYLNSGQDNDIDTNNVITRAIDENGFEYSYDEYLLIPENALTANGKLKKEYQDTKFNFPIMLEDGTNPKLTKRLQDLEETIRKEIDAYNSTTDESKRITDTEADNIVARKINSKIKSYEKAVQNYVIDNMKSIMSDPKNIVELETPISMDRVKAAIRKVNKEGYDYSKHGVTSFNSAWIAVLEDLNMQGKTGISAYANGQRTLSAILAVQAKIGRQLRIGNPDWRNFDGSGELRPYGTRSPYGFTLDLRRKNSRGKYVMRTVTRETYANSEASGKPIDSNLYAQIRDLDGVLTAEDQEKLNAAIDALNTSAYHEGQYRAWETMSQLLSAATDNAKALILGALGANNSTNTLITTMLIMGFTLDDVTDFLNDPDMKTLFTAFEKEQNEFKTSNILFFLSKRVLQDNAKRFEVKMHQLLIAGQEMSKFRKVLTFAQDNKIETRDLYSALSAIYSSDMSLTERVQLFDGVTTTFTDSELSVSYANYDFEKKSAVSEKNPKRIVKTSIFNPLFFVQNHDHSRAIFTSAL